MNESSQSDPVTPAHSVQERSSLIQTSKIDLTLSKMATIDHNNNNDYLDSHLIFPKAIVAWLSLHFSGEICVLYRKPISDIYHFWQSDSVAEANPNIGPLFFSDLAPSNITQPIGRSEVKSTKNTVK